MKNHMKNPILLFCLRERLSVAEFSKRVGIERTRTHRLTHAQNVAETLTVGEMKRIFRAFPFAEFDFFN